MKPTATNPDNGMGDIIYAIAFRMNGSGCSFNCDSYEYRCSISKCIYNEIEIFLYL